MFCKLALRNVRRSFRDYGVYLLTLTFGVCLFYAFNSIDGQGAMVYLSRSQNPMVEAIMTLIDVFSVFVAVVLACLILYADRFLLRRRKRELGTYLLLGQSQGQVSRLLFLETGVVGLASLAAGLVLGVAASYGMSALTLSMFELDMSGLLGLTFSWRAAGKTVLYFGLIFLVVMAFSGLEVSRARLIDLLQGERKNEELRQRPLGWAVVQLALGVLCLLAAYAILLFFGMAVAVAVLPICVPMLALGTLGTLLIFKSLSGFVLKFARSRPGFYYKDLNLFTLRQWLSKVHTTYLSQTVICILLLLAIGITASSVGLNSTLEQLTGQQAPFDLTVQNQSADWTGPEDFEGVLAEGGFDLSRLRWTADVLFYYNDPAVTGVSGANAALKLSAYATLLERQGRPSSTGPLPYLQCAVYCLDKEVTEIVLLPLLRPLNQMIGLRVESRLSIYQEVVGSKILALYLGLYLGFPFLLAAAAVLALQQLSQAADNAGRYAVLRRLGAEEKLVARSAGHQVALAFLLPLGLALVHSVVGMKAANDLIAMVGRVDSVGSSLAAALVLAAVYGGYFLATTLACRRMAAGETGDGK